MHSKRNANSQSNLERIRVFVPYNRTTEQDNTYLKRGNVARERECTSLESNRGIECLQYRISELGRGAGDQSLVVFVLGGLQCGCCCELVHDLCSLAKDLFVFESYLRTMDRLHPRHFSNLPCCVHSFYHLHLNLLLLPTTTTSLFITSRTTP